jgi:replicative DNA helicase
MAALEDRVLTKILKSGSLAEAIQRGTCEEHFLNSDSRNIFKFLKQHWFNPNTAGTLPTIQRVRQRWPAFTLTATSMDEEGALIALVDELKMKSFESDVRSVSDYFKELVDEDPENAVRVLKARFIELELRLNSGGENPGMGLQDILSMAEEHYEGAQTGAIYGVPWPWQCLTEDTLGKRAGDFIVFYGRMKSMKTWVLLYCAAMDYLQHNRRVLVWSREMSPLKLGLRMATLLSKVDYQLFKKGLLPPKMREHCFNVLQSLTKGNAKHDLRRGTSTGLRDMLLLGGKHAPKDLEGLKKKVDDFEPDVIYLDSFYHMDSQRSAQMTVRWQRVATVAEDVKAYAEDSSLPIVAVHQANRYGEKTYGNTLADMADADVIAREADLIIRMLKSPGYNELHEEDYEEEFIRVLQNSRAAPLPKNRHLPRIHLTRDAVQATQAPGLNPRLMEHLLRENGLKRVGGELALVMGGNREGTLEAFTIKAIPSYNFGLISDKPDMKKLKEWMKIDEKEDDKPVSPKKGGVTPKTSPADYAQAVANSNWK